MNHFKIALGIGTLFFVTLCLASFYICFPWTDSIFIMDGPVNYINTGELITNGYPYCRQPLYPLIEVIWFYIFPITHQSACILELLFVLLTFYFLIYIIQKHKFIQTPVGLYSFSILYWTGFYLPVIYLMGRFDGFDMFWAILLVYYILAPDSKRNNQIIFALSCINALAEIYQLPLICLFIAAMAIRKESRAEYVKKEILFLGGAIVGLLLCCIYFYYKGYLLSYIATTIGSSATVSGGRDWSHVFTILAGDAPVFILSLISIVLILRDNKGTVNQKIMIAVFIFLIPVFMNLFGRYERYYRWLFYIPAFLMFLYSLEGLRKKTVILILTTVVVCNLFYLIQIEKFGQRAIDTKYTATEYKEQIEECEKMVAKHSDLLKGKDVVFVHDTYYFPIINNNSTPWYIYNSWYPELVKADKKEGMISKEQKEKIKKIFNRKQIEQFPRDGYVFLYGSDEMTKFKEFCSTYNVVYDFIDGSSGICSLAHFVNKNERQ